MNDVIRVPANAVRLVQGLEPSPGLEGSLQQLDEAEFWRVFVTPEVRETARKKAQDLPGHHSWYSTPLTSVDWQPMLDEAEDVNKDRIGEFLRMLEGQLKVALEGGYDFTNLKFGIRAWKNTSPYPLIIELELSWPENE